MSLTVHLELFPYSTTRRGGAKINPKNLLLQATILFSVCASSAAITFVDYRPSLKTRNGILVAVYLTRRLASVIAVVSSYLWIIFKKNGVHDFYKSLDHRRRLPAMRYGWLKMEIASLLLMTGGAAAQEFGNRTGGKGHVKIATNWLLNCLLFGSLVRFRTIMSTLADRFNMLDPRTGCWTFSVQHTTLGNSSRAALKIFSLPLLAILAVVGINVQSNALYILSNKSHFWAQYLVSCLYTAYYFSLLVVDIVRPCVHVKNAADQATERMFRFAMQSTESCANLTIKHMLYSGNMEFRPLGFIALDYQFLCQFLATIISYTVLTLQYAQKYQH